VRATEVTIEGPITVRDLSDRMGVTGAELIKSLIRLGVVASLNQVLDPESARVAVSEMGLVVHSAVASEETAPVAEGADRQARTVEVEDDENLLPRPPVVTVMGHVDHGKTSLLDTIRKTNVTAGEAGGITQHIGASTVEWRGKRIVFLDTPGHEAFTAMRARGAQATDIAVLVVAADDGVMPQTLEAMNHARAAKVPIIVAMNKIDKANALPDRVRKQLGEHGLTPEEWGGDTVTVPVSAKERTGIDELLDMILLVAEMGELKADPRRRAKGIVLETRRDKGLGPVASVLVQAGTLRVGDPILAGTAFGRVRAMVDDKGQRLEEAGPSTPVEVTGLDDLPAAGDVFQVLADERMAREIAAQRDMRRREQEMGGTRAATSLADLFRQVREGARKHLNLVLKADVQGSLEALKQSFEKLEEPEIGLNVIHTGVGGVTETDVMLAAASDAIVIAFNVTPDSGARQAAEKRQVDVRTYRVIYDAINDVKAAIKGLRAPIYKEVILGHAEVRKLFKIPKVGTVAGCYVTDGKIARRNKLRVVRDGVIVHEGPMASFRHIKDDVREMAAGFECGIGLENFQDVKEGDILEAFSMEEVAS
jgi:translation initiation factor IF-2